VNIHQAVDEGEELDDADTDEGLGLEEIILVEVWIEWEVIWDEMTQERQGEEHSWVKMRVFLWLIYVAIMWGLMASRITL
jgi:hypothetical protein